MNIKREIIVPNKRNRNPLVFSNSDGQESDALLVATRICSIGNALVHTLLRNQKELVQSKMLIASWIRKKVPVRVLGAGRALLAGSIAGNRLSHAGIQTSYLGGMVPLPNSMCGGGIIACSASGKTKAVLEAMAVAKRRNPRIKTIGIADNKADEFRALCDIFIGLHWPKEEYPNPLSALADTAELMIAEIFDGLVVLAGHFLRFDDELWREGHEDIGPTGPYTLMTKLAGKQSCRELCAHQRTKTN